LDNGFIVKKMGKTGIAIKIAVILIAITTFTLTGFGTYQYVEIRSSLTAELAHLAELTKNRLKENAAMSMWQFNEWQIEQTILSEMKEKRVSAILVKDYNNKLIKGKKRDDDWKISESGDEFSGDFIIKKSGEVVYDNQKLGTVEIYFTKKFMLISLKNKIKEIILTIAVLNIFLLVSLILSVQKILIRPVSGIIRRLDNYADQLSFSAAQMSSASQSFARGTSEQSGAVQEASASLEMIASGTEKHKKNKKKADVLIKNMHQAVNTANDSMKRLTDSTKEISVASEKTAQIIKVIDQIAFQTNILALNAAVEAARAGDAGKGFAVVADEVRNLAAGSSKAVDKTSALTEDINQKIKNGFKLTSDMDEAFARVAESASGLLELLSNIAETSAEQTEGIARVGKAVSLTNDVTLQNTSDAEESASVAEELNAQAEEMKETVADLFTLINGRQDIWRR
jgi:methyl-accepting chemotaxis protein